MKYDLVFDGDEIHAYIIKRSRCHHANGFKSVQGERIPLQNIPKKTLVKLTQKGLAKIPKEVLP